MAHTYSYGEVLQFCRNLLAVSAFYQQQLSAFEPNVEKLLPWIQTYGSWGRFYAVPFEELFLKFMSLAELEPDDILPPEEELAQSPFDVESLSDFKAPEGLDEVDQAMGVLLSLALQGHIRAKDRYNQDIHGLLYEASTRQDMKALFEAITVDPAVLAVPAVQTVIAQAALINDDDFFKQLAQALRKTIPRRPEEAFDDIRYLYGVLEAVGIIDQLSDKEICKLFIDDLRLYSKHGKDPEGALLNLIQGFRLEPES